MMLTKRKLMPGDVIVSYKAAHRLNLAGSFFNWRVKAYSQGIYGKKCVFAEANHARVVAGNDYGDVWGFHWTYPTARFISIEDWMIDPSYAMVFRYMFGEASTGDYMKECLKHENDTYDVAQLLRVDLGLGGWFDWGDHHHFCSSGIRALQNKIIKLEDELPTYATPPCFWANKPDLFECINSSGRIAPKLSEPI